LIRLVDVDDSHHIRDDNEPTKGEDARHRNSRFQRQLQFERHSDGQEQDSKVDARVGNACAERQQVEIEALPMHGAIPE
jgi:hypothetical protein